MRSGMDTRYPSGDDDVSGQSGNDFFEVLDAFLAENIQPTSTELTDPNSYVLPIGAPVLPDTSHEHPTILPLQSLPQTEQVGIQHSHEYLQDPSVVQSAVSWPDVMVSSDATLSGPTGETYAGQGLVQDSQWIGSPAFPLDPGLDIPPISPRQVDPFQTGPQDEQYEPLSGHSSSSDHLSFPNYQTPVGQFFPPRTRRPTATITRPTEPDLGDTQGPVESSASSGYSQNPSSISSSQIDHSMQTSTVSFGSTPISLGDFVEPRPSPKVSQVRQSVASSKPQTFVPSMAQSSFASSQKPKGLPSQPLPSQIKEMQKTIVRHAKQSSPLESHSSSSSRLLQHQSSVSVTPSPPEKFVFPPRPEHVDKSRRSSSYSPGILSSSPQISPASTLSPSPSAYSTDRTSESQPDIVRERLLEKIQKRRGSISLEETEAPEAGNQETTPEERAKKAKRREQNRRAAQRCRQKKKQAADSIVGEFRKLQSCNTSLKQEIKKLNQQKDQLEQTLQHHLKECTWTTPQQQASGQPASTSTESVQQELVFPGPSSGATGPSGSFDDPDDMDEDSFDDSDTSDDDDE